jgi:hypothetical protein
MRPGPAPRLVVWLLEHYGSSSDNEALIGDLAERYHEGRSAFWCGKQAAVAVLVGALESIRSHRLATLRAMAAGWLAYWTLGYVFFHFGFYQVMLDSLALDNPDLLIGSWSPPVWWHNNSFGRIYTFGANAIATVAMGMIAVVSGWIVATVVSSESAIGCSYFQLHCTAFVDLLFDDAWLERRRLQLAMVGLFLDEQRPANARNLDGSADG